MGSSTIVEVFSIMRVVVQYKYFVLQKVNLKYELYVVRLIGIVAVLSRQK
jgi:hypothetical protein